LSDPRLISPMLDNFIMGEPVSDHHGVRCCPAMEKDTDNKYIVKIISVPATETQLDALLLTGAYPDEASALSYFKEVAERIIQEIDVLQKLSAQDAFLPFAECQLVPMESGKGYEIYLLSTYKTSLEKHFQHHSFTHLDALNLGLDLCAALSVCRRFGYLYIDLQPTNIYVTEQQYRIGDLGFVALDSLSYTSLPEKYRSAYTPAEISDAYSTLNTTMDIYAAGLILYQVYNGGSLPFSKDVVPGDLLPLPIYADREIGEIILKACNPDPNARWQDPAQMGQAIVDYMQRNGATDSPIVPPAEVDPQPELTSQIAGDDDKLSFTEDEFGNLSFLKDVSVEELGISEDPATYAALTGEVSEILTHADKLATIAVPAPVVVPEHIDITQIEVTEPEKERIISEVPSVEPIKEDPAPEPKSETPPRRVHTPHRRSAKSRKPHPGIIRAAVIALVLLVLTAGGYYLYNEYYLLPIDSLRVEGSETSLCVYVETSVDESLLQVLCVDTYGNQTPAKLLNGKAEFTNLIPNTAYSIKLVASGFHKLVGSTLISYSTPIQTNIIQFDAIMGINNGSVVLNIAVEGPDSTQWEVAYSAEGEEERFAAFSGHRVTINDLTLGKEYTFRLVPKEQLYLSGQSVVKFTPMKIVRPNQVEIISCMNNTLTVKWNAPEGESVSGWVVSCTGVNYNHTITTNENTATFRDLDHTAGYTVEVKANYMSVGEKVSIPANTATVTNLKVDETVKTALRITWDTSIPVPADGWMLHYTVSGIDNEKGFICTDNTATIHNMIPDATYYIWLTDTKGNLLLSSAHKIRTGAPVDYQQDFDTFLINRADMEFQMCKTLSILNWNGGSMRDIEFTTSFTSGQAASFLVKLLKEQLNSDDSVVVMYVIRNTEGTPIYTSIMNNSWTSLWSNGYCKLYIPSMPTSVGTYTAEVYFNNGLVTSQAFSIT